MTSAATSSDRPLQNLRFIRKRRHDLTARQARHPPSLPDKPRENCVKIRPWNWTTKGANPHTGNLRIADRQQHFFAALHKTFWWSTYADSGGINEAIPDSWEVQIYPYIKSYPVYQCPDDQVARATANPPWHPISYGMADNLNGGTLGMSASQYMQYSGMAGYTQNINSIYSWNAHNEVDVQVPSTTLMLVEYYAQYNYYSVAAGGTGADYASGPSINFPCAPPIYNYQ